MTTDYDKYLDGSPVPADKREWAETELNAGAAPDAIRAALHMTQHEEAK